MVCLKYIINPAIDCMVVALANRADQQRSSVLHRSSRLTLLSGEKYQTSPYSEPRIGQP